jgi:hypothetical protein
MPLVRRKLHSTRSDGGGIEGRSCAFGQSLRLSGCVIEGQPAAQPEQPPASKAKPARTRRKSRALAAHLHRDLRVHLPAHTKCPC